MRKLDVGGGRKIGDGEPCYIIAEAGSNHNGKMETAKQLIQKASEAGADAVKFQLFKAERMYVKPAGHAEYLKDKKSIYDLIKDMELPESWLDELSSFCDKKNIVFLASAFDEQGADILDKYVPIHKIASYESNHIPLIKHVAEKGKPAIISTGASTMAEVKEAVDAFYSAGNPKLALLQCTAKYPSPLTAANVRVVGTFKAEFGIPCGFSDHTRESFIAPLSAVALGANIIEKHFTLDNSLPGPDHKFALEPGELKQMVDYVRKTEESLGSWEKIVLSDEKELRTFAKRAVHAVKPIVKGETFTNDNLAVLRPGKMKAGMEPKYFSSVLGKRARRDIGKWEGIHNGDF